VLAHLIDKNRKGQLPGSAIESMAEMGFDPRQIRRKGLTNYQRFGESSWNLHFQALTSYVEDNDWLGLWQNPVYQGLSIGHWVRYQRHQARMGKLPPERKAALDGLGIQWNRKQDWWVDTVDAVAKFRREHTHQRFPVTSEYAAIRRKVSNLRTRLKKGDLPAPLVTRLQEIGFAGTFDDEYWEYSIRSLERWVADNASGALGRAEMPTPLSAFLGNQKRRFLATGLPKDRLIQLRDLGVKWAALDTLHTQMITRLSAIAKKLGRANVEVMAKREPDLNEWLQSQLTRVARSELNEDELADLRRVGIDLGELPIQKTRKAAG
jgi:hypothetical protein